jgi:hypothetical protein
MKHILIFVMAGWAATVFGQVVQKQNIADFLPKGYVIFAKENGDLNKDGIKDWVLIIKGTDKSKIVKHDSGQLLDQNRRGIIVLFGRKNAYELALKNYDCFSSENEDGGVYYPPELSIEIKKGNLYIGYAHGRYGYWAYNFRYQNSDFELIGYEGNNNHGPITKTTTSINFLTKKMLTKENLNQDKEENEDGYGEEVFKETWKTIRIEKLVKLSKIKDFDGLDMSVY